MKPTDIVDIVAYDPRFSGNLVVEQRDGARITLADYIAQQVAECLEKPPIPDLPKAKKIVLTYALVRYKEQEYKVWSEHVVERWLEGDDKITGSWVWMAPYEEHHSEVLQAGLAALEE